jgi:ubiquinone/menaquinone biosynthesis C-methylase UbiE
MLDLVRLSPRRLFPPGGIELYRQIALLTELSPEHEVLGVACGKGVSLEYFAKEFGVMASGVEHDPAMVERAEAWSRQEGIADRLQFQAGSSDSLPYRDDVFDLTIGEIGLAAHCAPADAVRELVRVTKPGGFVVLVQLAWKAPVDIVRRQVLSEHLGAKPLMVVEWKRLLREAGVHDVQTEDWSDEKTSFRSAVVKPFPDFAELFSLGERLRIVRRAWARWGWRGVSSALARETEVHRLLTNERILGLDVLRGRKESAPRQCSAHVEGAERGSERPPARHGARRAADEPVPASVAALRHPADGDGEEPAEDGPDEATFGLPLFGGSEPLPER